MAHERYSGKQRQAYELLDELYKQDREWGINELAAEIIKKVGLTENGAMVLVLWYQKNHR